jgi:hypothetical protein
MKDLNHIKRFNETQENLNISDVSNSLFFRYWDKQPLVYLSVDENGDEQMSDDKPVRQDVGGKGYWYSDTIRKSPSGFIEKLTGLSISWTDEPLQYIIKDKRTITDKEDKMLKKMARDLRKNNDY